MKLASTRPNVVTVTLTDRELAGLVAAARMALDTLRGHPRAPHEAVVLLERIIRDYDRALIRKQDGERG